MEVTELEVGKVCISPSRELIDVEPNPEFQSEANFRLVGD